ncbi:hypothetical protein ADL22_06500 [Streptomyces sp. NRRL F-4489]|uniref:hypothetical protein n=1 Tax=Streptomyces sp. NRRL F-4489 TaxID=1609095 RepID=UPI0007460214|nr:hypothetical protein [Streptomyces sp. NRRL F-4489]KUL51438.1 hypothetical protein ADL22_06500 [Streptomyces sp. NRRL F-4489]
MSGVRERNDARDGAPDGARLRRRTVLAAGPAVVLGAAGCTGRRTGPAATATARPGGGGTASALPAPPAWRPGPGEVHPEVKSRAVEVVRAIGAWPAGERDAARARVAALGLAPSLVDQAGALRPGGTEAVLEVVDAQYGGILADAASVLVVCRQWVRRADGRVVAGGTTVDVRLRRARPRWTVTALHPAAPGAPAEAPGEAARRVLAAGPAIELPPAAAADIRGGAVHTSVLEALLELARTHRIAVSVVRSGHPLNVFGTDRPSDHPRGRAVDVWRIDGHAVVDPATPRRLVESFMRQGAAAGSYNVGGPYQLAGGAAGQFFSDATHHDHVHLGFRS